MAEERATAKMIHLGSRSSQPYVNDEDLPKKEGKNIGEHQQVSFATFPRPQLCIQHCHCSIASGTSSMIDGSAGLQDNLLSVDKGH
jgi:hypothetical protein